MRISIIGSGAVGGTLAALLHRAGHEVAVTARGENLRAIREHGIRLDGGFGETVARVAADRHLTATPELAILATKAQDAEAALRPELEHLAGVPLLVVQNGLGGLVVARRIAPDSPLLGGLALFAASYLEPGHVTITGPNPMIVGAAPGTDRAVLDRVAGVLRAAMPIEVTDDIEGAQWTKLLINHVNALPAITGRSVQEVVAEPALLRVMTASMRETVGVARRAGVRFAPVQGVSGRILELVGLLPLGLGAFFPRLLARRMGSVPNPGSTLQSIRRGQRTEIDYLNGAVVAVAGRLGMPAPVNAGIVRLVHEVEESGRFLAATDVVARVPLR
ncbi:ketopantoate reductase family protein [Pseudolysinimonas sp.]|uniref:ketopantoate reductase family protein n=1 Tax=Pseudolysinimonas sp. TaxID=2680009 RepID=UPI003F82262E